jgi:creatinine amidohydrolase/Fe(II)-dependent formamide hydrolase-like protein
MKYELMLAHQIRAAIDANWPLVFPVGVLEYHSEHCAVGVDGLLVLRAVELLEKEMDLVVFPPYFLGTASYVVEKPERNGTVSVDAEVVLALMKEIFAGLLRVGFRNIHVFIHHQTENFQDGMPTDLAMKLAARKVIFGHLLQERGEGWWGDNRMQDYYSRHEQGDNPFNWIRIHPLMDAAAQREFPIDHAGRQETSLMLSFCPEGVDMSRHSKKKWYAREAAQANTEYGERAKKMILDAMRAILRG